MSGEDSPRLLKDPCLPWDGPFPYDWLGDRLERRGHARLTPDATAAEVKDAFFDLMGSEVPNAQDRASWDQLRRLDSRLVADFFLYAVPASELEKTVDALWDIDPPVAFPDFKELADVAPDPDTLRPPDRVEPGIAPGPVSLTGYASDAELPQIEFDPLDILRMLDEDHE